MRLLDAQAASLSIAMFVLRPQNITGDHQFSNAAFVLAYVYAMVAIFVDCSILGIEPFFAIVNLLMPLAFIAFLPAR